jgi:transposase InsO family protein
MLSSNRTVYKVLKGRHSVNRLSCKIKKRKYMRFNKKHPTAMVQQMDILLGPFYLRNSSTKNYIIISCIVDDCTRKVASRWWTQRKRSTRMYLMCCCRTGFVPLKPEKVMHDNNGRRQLTSKTFRRYLIKNDIKDRPMPAAYPQLQGKVEAYNKIVKNELFLAVEDISDVEYGKARYAMFVDAYNIDRREHGAIHGLTPQEMYWLQSLNTPVMNHNRLQKCYPCL